MWPLIHNPAGSGVLRKKSHQEMKTLRSEDLKTFLDAAERQNVLAMLYLELVSGIRKGKLVAWQWADLDVEQRTISVNKQASRGCNERSHRGKSENRELHPANLRSAGVGRATCERARQAPTQSLVPPLLPDWRHVPPGFCLYPVQTNPERRRIHATNLYPHHEAKAG